ncbi:MAG: Catabolite control protein A [Lentisphaerae bacterium ADurb.Bin242]|nr:MAG: Catabolite control protein A [Lentisphaerae bacterium ADurb.Bin242]
MNHISSAEIARKVNVSRQVVSAVLNDRKSVRVSESKCREILEIVRKFNYKPNPNARALAGKTAHTVGIIQPNFFSPLSSAIMAQLTRRFRNGGYDCYVLPARDSEEEKSVLAEFTVRRLEGILVAQLSDEANYAGLPVPSVIISNSKSCSDLCVDLHGGMRLALEHLHCHGRKNIIFLTDWIVGNPQKYEAYKEFARDHGMRELVVETKYGRNPFARAMDFIRKKNADAAAGTSDILAGIFINRLLRSGISVPEDVAVSGFDGGYLCLAGTTQLSSVVHPIMAITEQAVALLMEKIRNKLLERSRKPIVVKPKFFCGQTCGCQGFSGMLNDFPIHLEEASEDQKNSFRKNLIEG